MDQIVHTVRQQQWLTIAQTCNASGQSKNQWCDENGVDRRKVYYWQKKFRTELYQEAQEQSHTDLVQPSNTGNSQSALVELPASLMPPAKEEHFQLDAVISIGTVSVEISNTTSKALMECLRRRLSMLCNATGFEKFYITCGYTDPRFGIDGLAWTIQHKFKIDPFQKNVLFMFWAGEPTASSVCSGKAMVFFSYTSVWRMAVSSNLETWKK